VAAGGNGGGAVTARRGGGEGDAAGVIARGADFHKGGGLGAASAGFALPAGKIVSPADISRVKVVPQRRQGVALPNFCSATW
jgi:hypothetical protein